MLRPEREKCLALPRTSFLIAIGLDLYASTFWETYGFPLDPPKRLSMLQRVNSNQTVFQMCQDASLPRWEGLCLRSIPTPFQMELGERDVDPYNNSMYGAMFPFLGKSKKMELGDPSPLGGGFKPLSFGAASRVSLLKWSAWAV